MAAPVSPVRIGVIGLGAMGFNHVRALHEMGAKVTVAADPDEARRNLVERRFGIRTASDYRELLKSSDVDAVTIAVPTHLHYRVARDALEAGKHTLVEKPICRTIWEAEELAEMAVARGLTLAVGHIERHNPVVALAHQMLERGGLGEILAASARRVSGGGGRIGDVGVILDLAIHDIDVVLHLVDRPVVGVFAAAGPDTRREDRAQIVMEFSNGAFASIEANWRSPLKVRRLALTCSDGQLELDYIAQSLERSSSHVVANDEDNLYTLPREYELHRLAIKNQEPLKREMRDFLEAIGTRRQPLVTAHDGIRALEVALAASLAAQERRRITIAQ